MKSRLKHAPSPQETSAPEPGRLSRLRAGLGGFFTSTPEERWGAQFLRIASDMMVVCGEDLEILHHNRAFLKAVGYGEGNFHGRNLAEFFPMAERDGLFAAFLEWRRGHAAGMRFQAPLLTTKGLKPCDFRAVRSRDRDGSYVYYLVSRGAQEGARASRPGAEADSDPIFQGLPVAAWRTDGGLRITKVYGSLWPELGAASEDLVGEVFGRRHDTLLPEVLQGIDCSDTLAGMSLQTVVGREGETFTVTVEPFLDASGRIVGTVGFLRRAPVQAAPEQRPRHHRPPLSSVSLSVMTGPVPRLLAPGETDEDTRPVGTTAATRRLRPESA